MKKRSKVYNPEIELAKGATLDAASYDKTQKIKVTAAKVTVGGIPGRAEISGIATGHIPADGIEGTCDLWLSIFRYMRPDGTIDHVGGWNIPTVLKPGQTAASKSLRGLYQRRHQAVPCNRLRRQDKNSFHCEVDQILGYGGEMDCFLKLLRSVESLEKRLGSAATATDRASFRQYRRFARWNISLIRRRARCL